MHTLPETVLAIIKSNAEMAIDQRGSFPTVYDAIDSYYENVRDSLVEARLNTWLGQTFDAYRDAVRAERDKLGLVFTF